MAKSAEPSFTGGVRSPNVPAMPGQSQPKTPAPMPSSGKAIPGFTGGGVKDGKS